MLKATYAETWFISPQGTITGLGTQQSPWDITSTLAGKQNVRPGDNVYLLEGIYRCPDRGLDNQGYRISLKGSREQPIRIASAPGHHALVDGGLCVLEGTQYIHLENIEITASENQYMPRTISEKGSHPKSYNRIWGGLWIAGGDTCKYINLVIRDCAIGILFKQAAVNSEIYGCIIYDNGWKAPDRGHGHAIYTQNKEGSKLIENCIMTGGFGYTLHGYTGPTEPGRYVDNYQARRNICYKGGPSLFGGANPSKNILLVENVFYDLPKVQLGYSAPFNYDCQLIDNYFIKTPLVIKNFKEVKKEGNVNIDKMEPPVERCFIYKNRYDPNRAHVAVLNAKLAKEVDIDVSEFLKDGEAYCFLDPKDLWGKPVKEGIYRGQKLSVPVGDLFAAFVLLKAESPVKPQSRLGNPLQLTRNP